MNELRGWAGRLTLPAGLWPSREEWVGLPAATRATMLALFGWCILVGAVVLSAIIAIQIAAAGGAAPPANAVQAKAQSAAADDAILDRPLFVRSRQAAVAIPARLPPPPPPLVTTDSGVTLSGIFINGGIAKAFVTTAQNPAGVWLTPGEVAGGWRLVAVRPGEAEMQGGGGHIILPFAAGAGRR
ncbi:hypothetical protein [Tardiphaga robiniae]|uniref:Type II secretion system protein GspC N-terminal domain-containing protein n=1 Tax=Tardiphaga robiniae TaxID=943830 RepID=A0A7G6TUM9_9BRAD|nr:hypothetical protein [Tardiphaga robiniae]QND70461.1 hypothetical protein HB776_03785 [Tardiphaga robiniae]